MQLTRWMVALGAAGVLAFAGCGGDDEDASDSAVSGETNTAQETPTPAEGGAAADAGQQTFATTCGGCHTLSAADTNGQVGPNLDDLQPDKERVLAAIESGPGQMPSGLLSGADAEAVADFVSSSAGG